MSFRRHYGTGSYGASLVSSPVTTTYSSRGLGGYSSPYATPPYSPSHTNYGGGYGSYGKSAVRTRSSSLPRDSKERSVSRHSSFSRGCSPPRSTYLHHLHHDGSDSASTSGALLDLTNTALNRHHSFSGSKTAALPVTPSRSYSSRDYGSHYAAAKALARAARSKSVGSSSSINSLSSGYGSRSGSVSEKGDTARGSTTSLGSAVSSRPTSRSSSVGPENGDIDYKKLYEEQLAETHRVNERLRLTENELRQSRENIDLTTKKFNTRLAIAESEKREKRALERKLSEMEEELKQLQKLKAENEKLKAENRALTRVVSKLTNSATSGMGSLATLSK